MAFNCSLICVPVKLNAFFFVPTILTESNSDPKRTQQVFLPWRIENGKRKSHDPALSNILELVILSGNISLPAKTWHAHDAKKGYQQKTPTCLKAQKTAKPSPSISNLHPPFSTRSLWIKGQTFRVKMEDFLRQPAGSRQGVWRDAKVTPLGFCVRKNTAPPLCHPGLSAKHCGFALHDIQDEPSKAKTMLHVFIRFSNDSAPDSDHRGINGHHALILQGSLTAELV